MKKLILTIALVLSMSVSAYAHGGKHLRLIHNYDGEVSCPVAEVDGTLYVGVRDLCGFARSGDDVTWNDSLKAAVIGRGEACLYAGSCVYTLRGQKYTSEKPCLLIDGCLMAPLETAQALAGKNAGFTYDSETGELHYVCPEYLFGETPSDYIFNAVSVDLDGDMKELTDEVSRVAEASGLLGENARVTVKDVIKLSDGFGTVILTVDGEYPRDITVQVRGGIAVKVCDPCELGTRHAGNGYHHGWYR